MPQGIAAAGPPPRRPILPAVRRLQFQALQRERLRRRQIAVTVLVVYRERLAGLPGRRTRTIRHLEQLAPALGRCLELTAPARGKRERAERFGPDRASAAEPQRPTIRIIGARVEAGARVETTERDRFACVSCGVRSVLDQMKQMRRKSGERQEVETVVFEHGHQRARIA
jgi:hypothetical protein